MLNVTGETHSANFPTTPYAFDRTMGGPGDAFVSRFDPTGSYLAYSSFLGGTGHVFEQGMDAVSAGAGLISIAGSTDSTDFPTTPGAYDRTWNGGVDAFVAILRVARTMHVASVTPAYRPDEPGYDMGARIQIVFATGFPVARAAVTMEVGYPDGTKITATTTTGSTGIAVVVLRASETGTYTFTESEHNGVVSRLSGTVRR